MWEVEPKPGSRQLPTPETKTALPSATHAYSCSPPSGTLRIGLDISTPLLATRLTTVSPPCQAPDTGQSWALCRARGMAHQTLELTNFCRVVLRRPLFQTGTALLELRGRLNAGTSV